MTPPDDATCEVLTYDGECGSDATAVAYFEYKSEPDPDGGYRTLAVEERYVCEEHAKEGYEQPPKGVEVREHD